MDSIDLEYALLIADDEINKAEEAINARWPKCVCDIPNVVELCSFEQAEPVRRYCADCGRDVPP